MTLIYKTGNMLDAPGIPVIPVNCVGVMGAGLAKAAAEKWPWIIAPYKSYCAGGANSINPGDMELESNGDHVICLLATKAHWKYPSDLRWVEIGLVRLASGSWPEAVWNTPKLGCGLGGLDWKDVKPLMEKYLSDAPGTFNVWE